MKPIFVISTTYTKSLEEVGKFRQEHFDFIQKNILKFFFISYFKLALKKLSNLSNGIT